MVTITIDRNKLGSLFPAYILTDQSGIIQHYGPSLRRMCGAFLEGRRLQDMFALGGRNDFAEDLDLLSRNEIVELYLDERNLSLLGSVIPLETGYLMAMRIAPSQFTLGADGLQISDFGPDDPIVPGLLLVGLQKALIEEAEVSAMELGKERQRAAELLDRVSRMAGYLAHDFNNLVYIIRLNAERIARDARSAAHTRRLAGIISETAGRASEITRSLMTLSRQRFDSRLPLDPEALIRENLSFFRSLLGTNISLEVDFQASDQIIETSKVGLLNSIMNLLTNARDAMSGPGTVTISTSLRHNVLLSGQGADEALPRSYFILVISDNGPGMDAETLERAFKPLFSTKRNGTGLGLASVAEFAREMGGDACLDSEAGVGTTLHMYLPMAEVGEPISPSGETKVQPQAANDSHGKPRVLLVEDEPYALEALTEMLEDLGWHVTACETLDQAGSALGLGDLDLVLTDIILTDGSGVDIAETACRLIPGISVILMSGYVPARQTVRKDWQFICKPLDIQVLQQMLIEAARKRCQT